MIDPLSGAAQAPAGWNSAPRTVLKMVKNERTAGYIPSWEKAPVSASSGSAEAAAVPEDKPFGFADLLDMINPLQHIPVVSRLYRSITGDEIKPASQIIGGGIFGGPLGAAGGIFNVALERETGRDLAGNIAALVARRDLPPPGTRTAQAELPGIRTAGDFPASLLAFADLRQDSGIIMKKTGGGDAPPRREPITQVRLSPLPYDLY